MLYVIIFCCIQISLTHYERGGFLRCDRGILPLSHTTIRYFMNDRKIIFLEVFPYDCRKRIYIQSN